MSKISTKLTIVLDRDLALNCGDLEGKKLKQHQNSPVFEEVQRLSAFFSNRTIEYLTTSSYLWRIGKLKIISAWAKKNVLDLGSGIGLLDVVISDQGARVVGMDISLDDLREAGKIRNREDESLDLLLSKSPYLPFRSEYFDIVICSEVIEHIESPIRTLKQIKRVLKRDGILVIVTPNRTSLASIFDFIRELKVVRTALQLRERESEHTGLLTLKELASLLEDCRFRIERVDGISIGLSYLLNVCKVMFLRKTSLSRLLKVEQYFIPFRVLDEFLGQTFKPYACELLFICTPMIERDG